MSIYDAIIDDPASTENEKLMAKKAKERRSHLSRFQVPDGDEQKVLEIASPLGIVVERDNAATVVYGSKKQVNIVKELLALWQNMLPPVRDAVVFEILSALPASAFYDRMDTSKQKRFVKLPRTTLRPLTAMETAYAQSLAKHVLKEI